MDPAAVSPATSSVLVVSGIPMASPAAHGSAPANRSLSTAVHDLAPNSSTTGRDSHLTIHKPLKSP